MNPQPTPGALPDFLTVTEQGQATLSVLPLRFNQSTCELLIPVLLQDKNPSWAEKKSFLAAEDIYDVFLCMT